MALKSLGLSLLGASFLGATSVVEQNSLCESTCVYVCVRETERTTLVVVT